MVSLPEILIRESTQTSFSNLTAALEEYEAQPHVHPELMTDSPIPTFKFSNLRVIDKLSAKIWVDIPGKVVTRHLDLYARKLSILEKFRFQTEVSKVKRDGKEWKDCVKGNHNITSERKHSGAIFFLATGISSKLCTLQCLTFESTFRVTNLKQ